TVALTLRTGSGGNSDASSPFSTLTNDGASLTWTTSESGPWVIRRGGSDCGNGSMVTSGASGTSATLTSADATTSDKYRVCVTDAAGNMGGSADFEIIKNTTTTTTLARTAGSNPSTFGSPVTFTATVTA